MALFPSILVTFVCTNGTLTDCKTYIADMGTETACEAASLEVGRRAQILDVKETVLFYCTDMDGLEDLPVGEPDPGMPVDKYNFNGFGDY